jgi:hypothetical protein
MDSMLVGAIATASIVIALFFLRFWFTTGDRFFLFFSLSFTIEGLDRLFLSSAGMATTEHPAYYLIRLFAYGLIVFAIIDKNRPHDKK